MSRRTATVVAWSLVAFSAVVGFTGTGLKLAYSDVALTHFLSNDVMVIVLLLIGSPSVLAAMSKVALPGSFGSTAATSFSVAALYSS